jgi:hypothetical protein
MDDDLTDVQLDQSDRAETVDQTTSITDEIAVLQKDFQTRLVAANLRTEAVRAGMVDLDGLKLVDHSVVRLDGDDKVRGGRKLMEDLRRSKPWLFGIASSSSAAIAPASQPVKQKTAMDMTDDEYAAARTAVTKYRL